MPILPPVPESTVRAAAAIDRAIAAIVDRVAFPGSPQTGFAPVPAGYDESPLAADAAPVAAHTAPGFAAITPAALTRKVAPMSANSVRRLSGVLKEALATIQAEADALAHGVATSVKEFKATVAEGHAMRREIDTAHAEFKATLGLDSNGAPDDIPAADPLEQSPGS